MLDRSDLEHAGDTPTLVELLSTQTADLERIANETGASSMGPSTSHIIEMTLRNTLAMLRHARNSVRLVNKLPPEILSHIFFFVLHGGDELDNISHDFGLHTAGEPVENLLPLLSVCSHWRSIVTNSSFLWSTIDNRSIPALSISSKYRPVCGPLDAHIVDNFRPGQDGFGRHPEELPEFRELNASFLEVLRNEGHRMCEFFAEVPAVILPDLMDFPGESLRSCELWPSEFSDLDPIGGIHPLFRGRTPKLRSLVIGDHIFIPSNDFPSLTRLILAGGVSTAVPDHSSSTFANFMRFLSRCPNLEVLHLFAIDAMELQELPDDTISAPVNLQHLRKFSNEGVLLDQTGGQDFPYLGPQFRRALLAHIQLSPDCVIRLSTILPDNLGRTLHCLPFDNPFTSVYLGAHDPTWIGSTNALDLECFSIMATDPRRQRGVRIDFQMPGERYAPSHLVVTTEFARARVRNVIRSAPLLSGVHELWVMLTANALLWEPDSLLAGFPHLTTLVLGLLPSAPISPAMAGVEDGTVADCSDPLSALEVRDDLVIPCPKLYTLCVYGFIARQAMMLYNVVLSRGEAGYAIRRLVVGFYVPPRSTVLELVEGLWVLVEDFTLIIHGERCPEDLLWEHCLPSVCRENFEHNTYWPAWV